MIGRPRTAGVGPADARSQPRFRVARGTTTVSGKRVKKRVEPRSSSWCQPSDSPPQLPTCSYQRRSRAQRWSQPVETSSSHPSRTMVTFPDTHTVRRRYSNGVAKNRCLRSGRLRPRLAPRRHDNPASIGSRKSHGRRPPSGWNGLPAGLAYSAMAAACWSVNLRLSECHADAVKFRFFARWTRCSALAFQPRAFIA